MESVYIKQILAGDLSKFTYFVATYKHMAYTIAFRIVNNKEDAQDVVQDSFIRAYNSLSKFRNDSKFSTWFYKIVVNNSLTKIKRDNSESINIDSDEVSDIVIEDVESVYKRLTQEDQRKFINFALGELSIEDRLLLTLCYLNDNSTGEIAEITGIPQGNLKMKIHRARKKMYTILQRRLNSEIQHLL